MRKALGHGKLKVNAAHILAQLLFPLLISRYFY